MKKPTKVCSKCRESKELASFYKDKQKTDGVTSRCRVCIQIRTASYYQENRDERLTYSRARKSRKGVYRKNPEYERFRRVRDREKIAARMRANYLKKTGKLVPVSCLDCGSNNKLEAHHEDYSKPPVVAWLCSVCHGKRHWRAS